MQRDTDGDVGLPQAQAVAQRPQAARPPGGVRPPHGQRQQRGRPLEQQGHPCADLRQQEPGLLRHPRQRHPAVGRELQRVVERREVSPGHPLRADLLDARGDVDEDELVDREVAGPRGRGAPCPPRPPGDRQDEQGVEQHPVVAAARGAVQGEQGQQDLEQQERREPAPDPGDQSRGQPQAGGHQPPDRCGGRAAEGPDEPVILGHLPEAAVGRRQVDQLDDPGGDHVAQSPQDREAHADPHQRERGVVFPPIDPVGPAPPGAAHGYDRGTTIAQRVFTLARSPPRTRAGASERLRRSWTRTEDTSGSSSKREGATQRCTKFR